MPVAKDRQSTDTDRIGRGEACEGTAIAGSNAGGAALASAGGNAGDERPEVAAGCIGDDMGSADGVHNAEVSTLTMGDDGGATGMVSVSRCARSGIASDAISTTVHAVMCACGLRTRSSVKPSHTTAPSASDR